MTIAKDFRLGDLLLAEGYITTYQLEVALGDQKRSHLPLAQQLVQLGFITREEALKVVAERLDTDYIIMEDTEVSDDIVNMLDFQFCDQYQVMPVKIEENVLFVAMAHPQNLEYVDAISFKVGMPVHGMVCDHEGISYAHEKYYSGSMSSLDQMLKDMDVNLELMEEDDKNVSDIASQAGQGPVIQLLNQILKVAINDKSSDIHFEPYEDFFRIRYRVDGVLYELQNPPLSMAPAILARIKIIANLNISETRMPQDGRIPLRVENKLVDLRVSTVPTKFGESAVLRILDRTVVALDLHNMHLSDEDMVAIQKIIHKPNGIALVTGPTGSGKTTTLYACLNEINKEDIKIITNEDPVEYNIDGLIQVPINPDAGLSYANSLRATLRQDPDVILVGEIRDKETADIAIEAALTGHMVFSTLHTNDAPSSLTRLLDMGIDDFLITATLEAVIAQRLVRTICPHCKVGYKPTEESLYLLGLNPADVGEDMRFFRGEGCSQCRNSGYRGRVALYEIMLMTPNIRDLVLSGASVQEITEAAVQGGMKTLRQVGVEKVLGGLTTMDEVINSTVIED